MLGDEPLQLGGLPGGPELLILLLLAIMLFGSTKVPKVARASGEAIGEFRRGREEVEERLDEMQESETDDDEADAETGTTT